MYNMFHVNKDSVITMTTGLSQYDVCVVGSGLIGSAAARHLMENNPTLRVALIGPDEPQDRHETDILGSWYDECRLIRILDTDPIWATLAQRSVKGFHDLENKSGIKFYDPVGHLAIGTGSRLIATLEESAQQLNEEVEVLQSDALKKKFPFLNIKPNETGVFSPKNSGTLNPRKLVYAQQEVCTQLGCKIIRKVVDCVSQHGSKNWSLTLSNGQQITSHKVLVCVGGFSGFRSLLPGNVLPDLQLRGTVHLRVEVEADEWHKYKGMPSIVQEEYENVQEGHYVGCSIFPPTKYPDGKIYLKISAGMNHGVELKTNSQIHEWYIHGSDLMYEQRLLSLFRKNLPGKKLNNYRFDHNMMSFTSTRQVYVDMVAPNFGVALGGCGFAAKSSDEIGLMAARMVAKGEWDYDLPAQHFHFQAKPAPSKL